MRPRWSRHGAGLVVAIGALAVALALDGGATRAQPTPERPGSVSVQQVEPAPVPVPALPLVLQCFRLLEGDDPNATVLVRTDNFGNDLIGVRTSNQFCEAAYKLRPTHNEEYGNTVQHAFQCFKAEHGNEIGDPYLLQTANFGPDRVLVGQLVMLCESAVKVRLSPTGAELEQYGSVSPAHVLACYSLRFGLDPNAPVVLRTRNFGLDRALVRQATILCEESSKVHPQPGGVTTTTGRPTGRVWACFNTEGGDNRQIPAILGTRNFGRDRVLIGQAAMMCEQARKTPLYHLPPQTVDIEPAALPLQPAGR